jgi:hypothetical protein
MANPNVFEVHEACPLPKVIGRGRPYGKGKNLDMLGKMKEGDAIWDVPYKKAMSISFSARRSGIKISVRRLPNKLYGIWRLA